MCNEWMCPKSKSYTNRRNYIVGKPEMHIVKALQFVSFPQSGPSDARVHCKKYTCFGYQIASGMVSWNCRSTMQLSKWKFLPENLSCTIVRTIETKFVAVCCVIISHYPTCQHTQFNVKLNYWLPKVNQQHMIHWQSDQETSKSKE